MPSFFQLDGHFLKSGCELVGARGGAGAALDAGETGDSLINAHSFNESCNALSVTAASADKLNRLDDGLVVYGDLDSAGAGSLGGIGILFHILDSFRG